MKISRVTKINSLAKTRFLNLYEAEYENKVGKKRTWTMATRKSEEVINQKFFKNGQDMPDGVIIAAYHVDEKKLVIIRQFRIPVNDYVYELTAGLIDKGENSKDTIGRELKEETGLDLIEVLPNKGMDNLYVSVGMTDESLKFIYCTCKGKVSQEYLEEDECIETVLVSQEEAAELLNTKEKFDIKCYLLLQNFALNGEGLFI